MNNNSLNPNKPSSNDTIFDLASDISDFLVYIIDIVVITL